MYGVNVFLLCILSLEECAFFFKSDQCMHFHSFSNKHGLCESYSAPPIHQLTAILAAILAAILTAILATILATILTAILTAILSYTQIDTIENQEI